MAALWDEVKDDLDKPEISLSGSQQQRLCIARAVALDPIATMKIEELIAELKRDYTIGILTHNMQQAGRVSDKTAFFYMGRLIEFDRTERLFRQPKEKKTEDYITAVSDDWHERNKTHSAQFRRRSCDFAAEPIRRLEAITRVAVGEFNLRNDESPMNTTVDVDLDHSSVPWDIVAHLAQAPAGCARPKDVELSQR